MSYKKLGDILAKLHVRKPMAVSIKLMEDNRIYYHNLPNSFYNGIPIQSGGMEDSLEMNEEKIKYKHNGRIYRFILEKRIFDDNTITYSLISEAGKECIIFSVIDGLDFVNIGNVSYYKDCVEGGLKYPGGGTVLLKFTVNYIIHNKERLHAKKITLNDTSYFDCKNGKRIELSTMYFMLNGDTWYGKERFYLSSPSSNDSNHLRYGKYGFRPKDPPLRRLYERSKRIIKYTVLRNVPNLSKYIEESYNKVGSNINLQEVLEYVSKNPNMKLSQFLALFLDKFNDTCEMFYEFYHELAHDIRLDIFRGVTFELDIEHIDNNERYIP